MARRRTRTTRTRKQRARRSVLKGIAGIRRRYFARRKHRLVLRRSRRRVIRFRNYPFLYNVHTIVKDRRHYQAKKYIYTYGFMKKPAMSKIQEMVVRKLERKYGGRLIDIKIFKI